MLKRTYCLLSVTAAAALAVACSQAPEQAGRAPANPASKQVTAPAAPKDKTRTPFATWSRYWLT
jgi:PBP1b-binding outer membrane lipoprotein LpoB